MAVLPDYVTGTITLANGSTTVTGTGTMFATAAFRPGDTLQIQNLTAIIASVDSNTSLTLTEPWTGTSLTNAPYRARYLPDGARVTAQTTTLIELLGNGVLSNIAGIPVEDGNLLIGNTAGQYETISKDELGVQDPNGSLGKLAALTLAARQILQTDDNGALMAVALAANKALVTDANGDVTPIDLGTLGRALLALATGTSAQYVRGDGQLATLNKAAVGLGNVDNTSDAAKPISTATQTALNDKLSKTTDDYVDSSKNFRGPNSRVRMGNSAWTNAFEIFANMGADTNFGLVIQRTSGGQIMNIGSGNTANVSITGTLSKGGGTFLIDHPLDPFNRNLRHGFVEAPRYDLIYRGTVQLENGRATVDIDVASNMSPGTFAALTTNAVVTSLQNQDGFARLKPGSINGGSFEIICEDENCIDIVSWVVIAERNDPFVKSDLDQNTDSDGRFVPEFDKEDA
ncbi:hypothetical protein [Brucella intermedia]|uniref:hypothetical protein n=1 Tax=Brucella intermedia TaxID=94625 RepID=UPI00224A76C4|nr:hypothetical protein [Brucella intermedia]